MKLRKIQIEESDSIVAFKICTTFYVIRITLLCCYSVKIFLNSYRLYLHLDFPQTTSFVFLGTVSDYEQMSYPCRYSTKK